MDSKLPAALVLVALILSSTFLTWKGLVPSHAFFMVVGAALAWVAPKLGQVFSQGAHAKRHLGMSGEFSPEEVSTNPEGRSVKDKKE